MEAKCFDWQGTWTASPCYCGTAGLTSGTNCLNKGDANGPCFKQIQDGMGTEDPSAIVLQFGDSNFPAGVALSIVQYAADNCTAECPDFLSPDYYNSLGGTGGSSGTGGATGTGGSVGPGGTQGAGGSTSTGGASSAGGSSSNGCSISASDTILYDFKDSANGIGVSKNFTYGLNLTYTASGVAQFQAAAADGGTELMNVIAWDGSIGTPSAGSAQLNVPFSATYQSLDVGSKLSPPMDMSGKTLFACLRLDAGLYPSTTFDPTVTRGKCTQVKLLSEDAAHPGSPQSATAVNICPGDTGSWIELTYKPTTLLSSDGLSTAFDATQVASIFVDISDLNWGTSTSTPTFATFHLDHIGYR